MDAHALPRWVHKRDGRLVPFERDKISQALFAATEAQGRPDAFLARELADGVLHFLAQEAAGAQPTTEQISELIVKVTRELGQPDLAQAFVRRQSAAPVPEKKVKKDMLVAFSAEDRSADIGKRARRLFERKNVYTRDLAAAMQQGLLRGCLRGRPEAIDALLLDPGPGEAGWGEAVLEQIASLRGQVSKAFVLYAPDQRLEDASLAEAWLRQLSLLLHAVRRVAVLHLHVPTSPRADMGPLFPRADQESPQRAAVAVGLLREQGRRPRGFEQVRLDWHVSPTNTQRPEEVSLCNDAALSRWTVDCEGDAADLGDGISREQPAALATIGLGLSRLLDLSGVDGRLDGFLEKLPSLVAMAASAAAQKRAFLTRMLPAGSYLAQGFLTHRASLCLRLRGLKRVIQRLLGQDAEQSKEGMDLARLIAHTVVQNALHQGRTRNLEIQASVRWSLDSDTTDATRKAAALAGNLSAVGASVTLTGPEAFIRAEGRLRALLKIMEEAGIPRLQVDPITPASND